MTGEAPDYLAVGHITIDLSPDGSPVLGGTALYSALTAARFGLRAAVLTRGLFTGYGDAIIEAFNRFAGEVDIVLQSAPQPTVFTNVAVAGRRVQTIHSWAGRIDLSGVPPQWRSTSIVHLAPVAQEIDPRQAGRLNPTFLGTTPQGWMRRWPSEQHGPVTLSQLRLPTELLSRIDALVVNSAEQALARDVIDAVAARGVVAITRGPQGAEVLDRGRSFEIPAIPVRAVDDAGAGDVFAATLFVMRADQESTIASSRAAAVAAALRIQNSGPDAVPTREDVEDYLEQHPPQQTRRARTF
jgi:sugar/nucleoside kinase (ribokinase family)